MKQNLRETASLSACTTEYKLEYFCCPTTRPPPPQRKALQSTQYLKSHSVSFRGYLIIINNNNDKYNLFSASTPSKGGAEHLIMIAKFHKNKMQVMRRWTVHDDVDVTGALAEFS